MIIILVSIITGVASMDQTTVDLLTPMKELGEACGYDSCTPIEADKLNVHIVPHTHGELGYTKTFQQHYTGVDDVYDKSVINMKRILDYTISELWANPERRFTFSDLPYLFHWWANRDGSVHRMVYQLLRQGRLQLVGGGWSMPDEAGTTYGNIVDQYTYALRKLNSTFLSCGRPLVSWQADVFGHSREFTSLTALMGFHGLFINPISYDDELGRMQRKEMEMVWRGSDDLGSESDIFTHKLFDGYWSPPGFCFGGMCNDPLLVTPDNHYINVEERVRKFIESVKYRQSPHYGTNNIMVVMGMRMGYFDAPTWFRNIEVLIERVNKQALEDGEKINLMYSTPACYLDAVRQSSPSLPIKQDDFMAVAYDKYTHFTGMYTSRPTIKYMLREGFVYLQMCKQLQVLARLSNNDVLFEELNWIVGVFQDHNIISGGMRPHVKNYYTQKMYHAVQKATLLLKQAFNKLRNSPKHTIYYRCAFNESSCTNTDSLIYFVVIYNPLSWPVTIPVRLPMSKPKHYDVLDPNKQYIKAAVIKIPEHIQNMPQRKSQAKFELVFLANDLPPMGYRSYLISHRKRYTRSIIKKIKNNNKKYFTRQTDNMSIDEKSLLLGENYVESTTDMLMNESFISNVTKNMNLSYVPFRYTPTPLETMQPTQETTEAQYMPQRMKAPKEKKSYYIYTESDENFIGNRYIKLYLDETKQVTSLQLSNGLHIVLKIQLMYYASDDPKKLGRTSEREPGAYVFKPMDPLPVEIKENLTCDVIKVEFLEELHCSFASYASFVVRVYEEKPFVEVDWVVGPIPIDDSIGKDVFIRYITSIYSDGTFYTDSNGRQTIKRMRSQRPTYEPVFPDAIAGNFYPVNSRIYIENATLNVRLSVFNDRAQGGCSLHDGQIDLMVHRRILTDDSGVRTDLNDTCNDAGIVVRGKHYLYLSKVNHKLNRIFEKKLAREIELYPRVLVSPYNSYGRYTKTFWSRENNEFSGINYKLPVGVNIMTLEQWNDGTLLVRLENYLEKSDVVKTGLKTVFIKNLFKNITIFSAKETTLAANIWLKDWQPLKWMTKEKFSRSFNEFYGGNDSIVYSEDKMKETEEVDIEKGITLRPQQIRTFVVTFQYK